MNNKTEIIITASDKTQQAFNSVKSSLNGLKSLAGTLGLGAAFSVTGILAFTKSTIGALDNMNDLSKSTGLAVEKLAGLKLAAEQSGGDLESIASSINKLSVNIGKSGEKFTALGITAKDPLEAFKQLSDIFVAIEDPQQRAAVAAEALGKSWAGAAPLLAEGSKKIQEMVDKGTAVSGVTKEATEAADKFKDRLNELQTAAGGVGVSLVSDLLPPMTRLLEIMQKGASEGAGFTDRLKAIGLFLGPLAAIPALNDAFSKTPEEKGQAQSGKIRPANNAPAPAGATPEQLCVFHGGYWDGKQCLDKKPTIKTNKIASGKSEAEAAAEDVAKLLKSFQDATAPSRELSESLQEQLDVYSKIDPKVKDYLQNIIAQTSAQEAFTRAAEQTNEEMLAVQESDDAAQARYDAYSKEYTAILEETQDINLQMIKSDEKRAAAQLEIDHERRVERISNMEIEADEIEALLEAENERFAAAAKKNADGLKKTKTIGQELGLTFKSAFEDAIVGGKKFSDVLKGIEEDLVRMLARRTVTEPLLKGIGGFIDDFDFGALFSGLGFASGGRPPLNKLSLVGERGPELFMPDSTGRIIPNNALGGSNVTVNIIGAPAQPEVRQRNDGNGGMSVDVIFDAVKSALTKDIRSEGVFAQTLQGQYGLNRAAGAR